MRPRAIAFSLLLAVALFVVLLARALRSPPEIPRDPDHRPGRTVERCLSCHGPDGRSPRSKNHPLGNQCFQCHRWAEAAQGSPP